MLYSLSDTTFLISHTITLDNLPKPFHTHTKVINLPCTLTLLFLFVNLRLDKEA